MNTDEMTKLMTKAMKDGELKQDVYRQVKFLIEGEGYPIPEILRAICEYIKYDMTRDKFPKGGYRPQ